VQFTGGEVFLEANLTERIITYAQERAREVGKLIRFRVQTNGTLFTPALLQRLLDLDIGIGISLDGDRATNDLTRVFPGNKSSYEAVTRTISIFKERNLGLCALLVVTKANYRRFNQIVDHFSELGLTRVKTTPVLRQGRASDQWHSLGLQPEDFLETHRAYLDYAINQENPLLDADMCGMLEKVAGCKHSNRCGAAREILTFNPDGDVYACQRYRHHEELRLANVWNLTGLRGLGNSNPLVGRLNKMQLSTIPECRECAYLHFCGSSSCPMESYLEFGTTEVANPWCAYTQGIYREIFGRLAESPRIMEIFYPRGQVYEKSLFAEQL
jgi:uncharacterized protein